jgi:hypothetical protein
MKDQDSKEEQIKHDETYSPSSEDETKARQEDPRRSEATNDPDIDQDDVTVLPGTGGPDDTGDVSVDPAEIRDLPGYGGR